MITRPAKRRARRSPEVRTPRPNDWLPEEVAHLLRLYAHGSREELVAAIPGRTWIGIRRQACKQGIARALDNRAQRWKTYELDLLRKLYPTKGMVATHAALPGYTEIAIRRQAYNLGIKAFRPVKPKKPSPRLLVKQVQAAAREKKAREQRLAALKLEAQRAKDKEKAKAKKKQRVKAKPVKKKPVVRAVAKPAPVVPAKVLHIQPAPDSAKHRPAPKNSLPPLQLPIAPPAFASIKTPKAAAQRAAVAMRRAKENQKPAGYVSAEQIKALKPTHPARLAYTRAAYHGMDAAQKAYHEAMSQLQQAA